MIQHAARRSTGRSGLVVLAAALLLAACAPVVEPAGPPVTAPRLAPEGIVAADGAILPLRKWMPNGETPKAAIVALHGFNDYSKAFESPAAQLAKAGIAVYAYDQRGFGEAPHRRIWAGTATLVADARTALALVRGIHPGTPVYLMGASMGGAVALLASTANGNPAPNGAILVGPAVWGRRYMGAVPRAALWFFARTVPWFPLTGEGLNIQPSDNIEMLRALGRDPLVIKNTRVDAVKGLVDLMDAALAAGPRVHVRTLILVGTKDELVPAEPTRALLRSLPASAPARAAVYPDGYHMLLRDLEAARVVRDIVAWIADPAAALPSGAGADVAPFLNGTAKPDP